jgi:hypothetical protein
MDEIRKQFLKIRKKLWKARKHAAKGKTGAAERVKGWEGDLLMHVAKHGKPSGL